MAFLGSATLKLSTFRATNERNPATKPFRVSRLCLTVWQSNTKPCRANFNSMHVLIQKLCWKRTLDEMFWHILYTLYHTRHCTCFKLEWTGLYNWNILSVFFAKSWSWGPLVKPGKVLNILAHHNFYTQKLRLKQSNWSGPILLAVCTLPSDFVGGYMHG